MKEYDKYFQEKKKMNKTLKRIIWIVVISLFILFIVFRITSSIKKKAEAAKKQALLAQKTSVPVEVQKITKEKFIVMLDYHGDIEGTETVNLYADYTGKIIRVYAVEGQSVRKGQTVAVMNRDVVVQRFEDFPIKALISGIVGKIFLKEGETVTTNSPIMSVVNMYSVKCITKVVEKDLGRIKLKDEVLLHVDAYPDVVFKGIVNEISPILDPLSRTSEIKILVPNYKYPKTPLKPGMYASVKIVVGEIPNSLLVPYSSVIQDEQGNSYIFVYRENKAKKVIVKAAGIKHYGEDTTKDKIVVTGDIKENEYVVFVGTQFLNDGDKIKFKIDDKKFGPDGEEK